MISVLSPFARGTVFILAAMFLFDVMGAIIKYLGSGYSAQQLAVLRNLFGLIPSFLVLVVSRDWHRAGRPLAMSQWRLGLVRGLFVAFAQFCFYSSLIYLEFATATTLSFSGPLFITVLSVLILGERVGLWRWCAVVIGFAGIVLIMRPGSDIFTLHALLPVGAAVGYATSSVLVKKIRDNALPTATINLYATVGSLLGAIMLVVATDGWRPVASAHDWLWIVAMGAAGGFAVLALIAAYRSAHPASIAPFEYFGIPFSFIIGWVVFAEAPFERLFPGALLIVAGGLVIVWRERVNARIQTSHPGRPQE